MVAGVLEGLWGASWAQETNNHGVVNFATMPYHFINVLICIYIYIYTEREREGDPWLVIHCVIKFHKCNIIS